MSTVLRPIVLLIATICFPGLVAVAPTSAATSAAMKRTPSDTRVVTASAAPDPAARGPFTTARLDAIRGWERVAIGFPWGQVGERGLLVEDVAEITYPVSPTGDIPTGRYPVVVLLHGIFQMCAAKGIAVSPVPTWCQGMGDRPVPSHRGYRYLADVLASQGRIVVSISSNGLNVVDGSSSFDAMASAMQARGTLVIHHLRTLSTANRKAVTGLGNRFIGHVDLSRVVLIGHSRGGEGVVVAAQQLERMTNPPAKVAGVIALASTAIARTAPANTPTMALLPACDGDVRSLAGQTYVDRGRDLYGGAGHLRTSVWFAGGNHNYLNTEWTPGTSVSGLGRDDAEFIYGDFQESGSCRPSARLSPAEQRTVALAYVTAFTRWRQDRNTAMLPILDGTGTVPRSVVRAKATTRVSSLAGPDRLLAIPGPQTDVDAVGIEADLCTGSEVPGDDPAYEDYCGFGRVSIGNDTAWLGLPLSGLALPGRTAVRLSWNRPGSAWMELGPTRDLSDSRRLSARVVVDPETTGTLTMVIRDATGASATLPVRGQPLVPLTSGAAANRLVPQQAWINLADVSGVDLSQVTAVGLAVTGSGTAWILDISHRTAEAAPAAQILPLSSVESKTATIPSGTSTVNVTIRLDRPATRPARFAVGVTLPVDLAATIATSIVTVPVGAQSAHFSITVTAPGGGTPDQAFTGTVVAYPLSGAMASGNYGYLSLTR